jgi:hypothetical protein
MQKQTSGTSGIRKFAQERILREMLESANNESVKKGKKPAGYLLVIDNHTLKIVNSIVQFKDLIERGIVGIEKLELKRKKFETMHAIYFIEPNEDNLLLINEDITNKLYNCGAPVFHEECA